MLNSFIDKSHSYMRIKTLSFSWFLLSSLLLCSSIECMEEKQHKISTVKKTGEQLSRTQRAAQMAKKITQKTYSTCMTSAGILLAYNWTYQHGVKPLVTYYSPESARTDYDFIPSHTYNFLITQLKEGGVANPEAVKIEYGNSFRVDAKHGKDYLIIKPDLQDDIESWHKNTECNFPKTNNSSQPLSPELEMLKRKIRQHMGTAAHEANHIKNKDKVNSAIAAIAITAATTGILYSSQKIIQNKILKTPLKTPSKGWRFVAGELKKPAKGFLVGSVGIGSWQALWRSWEKRADLDIQDPEKVAGLIDFLASHYEDQILEPIASAGGQKIPVLRATYETHPELLYMVDPVHPPIPVRLKYLEEHKARLEAERKP